MSPAEKSWELASRIPANAFHGSAITAGPIEVAAIRKALLPMDELIFVPSEENIVIPRSSKEPLALVVS